jgi:hypothetical protein
VIDEIATQATLTGKVKGEARRAMTAALAIRATVLMALLPDADYGEVLAVLAGDLVLVPWQRPYRVPTGKVLSTWREALGPAPLTELKRRLLAAVDAGHRDHDYRACHVGDSGHELRLGSIDGSVTRVPDTPASREAFGPAGTADDSAPCPQVRDLLAADAFTRAAARHAAPARKGRRAGQAVHPREISFTAARRAVLASIRSGAATASLPAPMAGTFHRDTLHALGKRRIIIDRRRHRDRDSAG